MLIIFLMIISLLQKSVRAQASSICLERGYYYDKDAKSCLNCHNQCSSGQSQSLPFCIGPQPDDCLQCREHSDYRVLDSWDCVKECPPDTFPVAAPLSTKTANNSIFRYCRGTQYFVDPSSTSSGIELGTLAYPYKSLDDPFRELFNFGVPYYQKSPRLVRIFVKHGSNITIHSEQMPLLILNSNIVLEPYLDEKQLGLIDIENNKTEVAIYHQEYARQLFSFNPTFTLKGDDGSWLEHPILQGYDYNKLISLGLLSELLASVEKLKFVVFNGNLTVSNFFFNEVTYFYTTTNALFYMYHGPFTWLKVDRCNVHNRAFLFMTLEGVNVRIVNNFLNITDNIQLCNFQASRKCEYYENPKSYTGVANNVIFDNNTFTGLTVDAWEEYIHIMDYSNITFTNNQIVDIAWGTNSFFLVEHFVTSCTHDQLYELYVFENNTVANYERSYQSKVYFTIQMNAIGKNDIFISNNYFYNIMVDQKSFFDIQKPNLHALQLAIKNITIEAVYDLSSATRLFIVEGEQVNISDLNVINSHISQVLQLTAIEATLHNIKIKNYLRSNTEKKTLIIDSIFLIYMSTRVMMNNFTCSDCNFQTASLISFVESDDVSIENVLINSTLIDSNHLIYLSSVKKFSALDVTAQDGTKSSIFMASLFYIDRLAPYRTDEEIVYTLKNVVIQDSQHAMLHINDVLKDRVKDTLPQITFSISNVTLQRIPLTGKEGLVIFNNFRYKKLKMLLAEVTITEIKAELGAFFQLSHSSEIFSIRDAFVIGNKGEFMSIMSEEQLMVSLENIQFVNNSAEQAQIHNLKNCFLSVTDSTFENNYSISRGSILQTESLNSTNSFFNCTFKKNYAILGGVFHIQNRASVSTEDSLFLENFAYHGGVLYQQGEGMATLSNSTFVGNTAIYAGIIYTISSLSPIELSGGKILNNGFQSKSQQETRELIEAFSEEYKGKLEAAEGKSIEHIIESCLKRDSYQIQATKAIVYLKNNLTVCEQSSLLHVMSASILQVEGLQYQSTTTTSQSLIMIEQSLFQLKDVSFSNITKGSDGTFLIELLFDSLGSVQNLAVTDSFIAIALINGVSQVTISQVNLLNIVHDYQTSSLIQIEKSKIDLSGLTIERVIKSNQTAAAKNSTMHQYAFPFLFLDASEINMQRVMLRTFEGKFIEAIKSSQIGIRDALIERNIKSMDSSSLIYVDSSNLDIDSSAFLNIEGQSGSIVYSYDTPYFLSQAEVIIKRSHFENITGVQDGGAIILIGGNSRIENSTFKKCHSTSGRGGAIAAICSSFNSQSKSLMVQQYLLCRVQCKPQGQQFQFQLGQGSRRCYLLQPLFTDRPVAKHLPSQLSTLRA